MSGLVMHPLTADRLAAVASAPPQALLLEGPTGSGKFSVAVELAEAILQLPAGEFQKYGYGFVIRPSETRAIGIEAIRELERFLSLQVPSPKTYNRLAIIENGHRLSLEAQNALLKTLEEPPVGTIIIITADHARSLLPTVRSRVQIVPVQPPEKLSLEEYFKAQGHSEVTIAQAHAISGGMPGLMQALLNDDEHPLTAAVESARRLLSQPLFERLVIIDTLSKDRLLATDVVNVLQRMAQVSLRTAADSSATRWRKVQRASYDAAEALSMSAQPKLALTDLVLQF